MTINKGYRDAHGDHHAFIFYMVSALFQQLVVDRGGISASDHHHGATGKTIIVTLNELEEVTIIVTISPSCAELVFKLSWGLVDV